MRKSFFKWSALAMCCITLTGCASIQELPEEKEDAVANYMANIVLKHDKEIDYIYQKTKEPATLMPMVTVTPKPKPTKSATESPKDTDSPKESEAPAKSEKPVEEDTGIELSKVFGISDLEFKVKGYKVLNSYEGDTNNSYLVEPEKGNKFLMIEVSITNTGDKANKIKFDGENAIYSIDVNGTVIKPSITAITEDILYLDTTLEAGKTYNALAVFQIDKKVNVESLKFITESKNGRSITILK